MTADETPAEVVARLTPEQAAALYDLACWALDDDQYHAGLWAAMGPTAITPAALKTAAAALIAGGAEGVAYA